MPPEKLPFDVLGIIFAYYTETETLFHSLETLLLVSRSWNLAATHHKALWGNLHIHLGHVPTYRAWKIILPRRLERAGSAPLSINIRYALEGFDHPFYEEDTCAWYPEGYKEEHDCRCARNAGKSVQYLLNILKGPDGEYCNRWTELYITVGGLYKPDHGLANFRKEHGSLSISEFLSHPTPLIDTIHLQGVKLYKDKFNTLFSYTPCVRHVHFERCTIESFDGVNFSSARSITIRAIYMTHNTTNIFNFTPSTAIQVIDIDSRLSDSFCISGPLLHLHTLHLGIRTHFSVLGPDFHFPSLKTLTIPMELTENENDRYTPFFDRFFSSTNHPFSTVKVLKLVQSRIVSRQPLSILKPFLDGLECIERLTASREVLAHVLKHVLEANVQREGSRIWRNLSGKTLELVHEDSVARLVFNETMQEVDICAACRAFELPDSMLSWDGYLEDLYSRDNFSLALCR